MPCTKQLASIRICLALALLPLSALMAAPQEDVRGKYRVGDRVECDFQHGSGEYKPGTVAVVEGAGSTLTCCRYRVKIDNDDPLWSEGRLCSERFIRPVGAAEAAASDRSQTTLPAGPSRPKSSPAPGEQGGLDRPADRPILSCPIEQKPADPGARPQPELLQKLVRCLFERPASGTTAATTVDIGAFQIGTPRKWRPLDDIGSGNLNTLVYPAKVTWTMKKFHDSFTRIEENISIFNCYVNAFGEWECGLGQRIRDGEAKTIPR